ncbi:MAG: archaetidylserine decarboxylase [Steroidobacteraceae bacterium]
MSTEIVPPNPPRSPDFAPRQPGLGTRAFIALQHVLPQHAISRLIHALARSQTPWIKNLFIREFSRLFRPDLSDALQPDPYAYDSFNAFFTRALRSDARPLPDNPLALASPVDGTVSEIGDIDEDRLLQAKGRHYTLDALLAGRQEWIERFRHGRFATIYLAPYNYHRIHMTCDSTLQDVWFVPGRLFSVNRVTADGVANLFARNERVNVFFEEAGLAHGLVMVGALNVGSIETIWHGEVAPRRPRTLTRLPLTELNREMRRGDEIGRFNMGSTVILLFPKDSIRWREGLKSGDIVRMGETIGERL